MLGLEFIVATNTKRENMSDQINRNEIKTNNTHSKKEIRIAKFALVFAAAVCLSLFAFTTPTVTTTGDAAPTINHASTQMV